MSTPSQSVTYQEVNNFLIVNLGQNGERAVILTRKRMEELESTVDSLLTLKDLQSYSGVIFTTPEDVPFCMGADINAIKEVTDPKIGEQLAKDGQRIFQKIEDLTIPTFAVIHGPCVGGGCELALACDFRIISDSPKSQIGLPETKLGILPGFGGTQRLPKLIGLPQALDIILGGKVISPKRAFNIGLVDRVIEEPEAGNKLGTIISECTKLIGRKRPQKTPFVERILSNNMLGRLFCSTLAERAALKKTKGQYPAIPAAIKSTTSAFNPNKHEAYAQEAQMLGELITTKESKALVHIFFLTESAAKLGKNASFLSSLQKLGIIGAGVMGKGIASTGIRRGLAIHVVDPNESVHQALKSHVQKHLSRGRGSANKEADDNIPNLTFSTRTDTLSDVDIVIEAAVENLSVKKEIFSSIESVTKSSCILSTNTSSLSLSQIFSEIKDPSKSIGIHFFNPVEKMPLIELVRTDDTSDQTLAIAASLVQKLGKYPVVVQDVPGFLVNRILAPFLAEVSLLASEGVPVETLEQEALAFGFPMGPFRLLDEVGLDIGLKVQQVLTDAYGDRMKGSGMLQTAVSEGLLGKKNSLGFYIHSGGNASLNREYFLKHNFSLGGGASAEIRQSCQERFLLAIGIEAIRAYNEGVAGAPGLGAIGQIDLSSIMGFGFPPFRGGIFYHLRQLGPKAVNLMLKKHQGVSQGNCPRFQIPESEVETIFRP